MSAARCCCDRGTYTRITPCECTDGETDPIYVNDYEPSLGCVYIKVTATGVCYYAGPESPTKETLDPGDVLLSSPRSMVSVESPEKACCLCCECGGTNGSPLSCFDTTGTCECCPETDDATEGIWTWQTSYLWEAESGDNLVPVIQLTSIGSLRMRNDGTCLEVDIWYDITRWSSGTPVCSDFVHVTSCAALDADALADLVMPCGEPLVIGDQDPGDSWRVPWPASLTCTEGTFAPFIDWDSDVFDMTDPCAWTGKTVDTGTFFDVCSGGINFEGDCERSRVQWDYDWTRTRKSDGDLEQRGSFAGFLEFNLSVPSCPGGCGARARFFGVNSIPPAGLSPMPVVRNPGELLR